VVHEASRKHAESLAPVAANPRPPENAINPAMLDALDCAQHANERLMELLRMIPRKYLVK
jgi:hypothetical protein